MIRLGDFTSPAVGEGRVLVLPIGATEQHGPHLPLDTDTVIARTVAETAAMRATGVVVAPAIAIGASGEHAGLPGTLSVGTEVLTSMVLEIVRTAGAEFDRVVVVNAHGGNLPALKTAAATCEYEGRPITVWHATLVDPGVVDLHAGYTETSVMLAIDAARVRLDLAEPGAEGPASELLREIMRSGVKHVSPNGVLGNPAGATAAAGEEILADWVRQVVALLES
ncbi:MAG: mycofactocin biosynthesis peptidyl-dipeptidase MftE [Actinomycetota bacterium]